MSQRTVAELTCPPGRKDTLVFDQDLPGFGVRITPAAKIFLVQYTVGGVKRRARIGVFGKPLTVDAARREALILLGRVAGGHDPQAERQVAAKAARAAETAASFTFARMVAEWGAARGADRRPSYMNEATACLARNLPAWKDRSANGITFAEATQQLDDIKVNKGPVAANRTLSYARACFGWAVRRQRLAINPLKGIERPGREVPRDRVLSIREMAAIWRACDTLSTIRASFVRLLMLTLQRVGEVDRMCWGEFDIPTAPTVWVVPAEHAKNRRAHAVHLSEPVRAIIGSLPRVRGNPFVFAGKGRGHLNGGTHTKEPIEIALAAMGISISNWRLHDFRRAAVTALANRGVAPHVADRLLNHVTGSIQGVAAVYQRSEFLTERAAALDLLARLVLDEVAVQAKGRTAP